MALTKVIEPQITVMPSGQLLVKEVTKIMEDDVEVSRTNHRYVVEPGEEAPAESKVALDPLFVDIKRAAHTNERKLAHANKMVGRS